MAKKKTKKALLKRRKRIQKSVVSLFLLLLLAVACYFFQDELPFLNGQDATPSAGNGTLGGQISTVPSPDETGYLSVHYIDVGQGDSILLTCGGEYMLIDAGENDGDDTVIRYLSDLGIQSLDLVVATHAHSDHIGEMDDVLAAVPAKEVWYPDYRHGTKTENAFLAAAEACGATVRQPELGETYALGDATVTVLGPVKNDYSDPNDMSIIIMAQYGDSKFLFTGDMEATDGAESDLVHYYEGTDTLRADVLKVGHHGSDTSTHYAFLNAVRPDYAVISVGEGNSYGHPKQEALDILGQAEVYVYRTDDMGTVVAVSDGTTVRFGWNNADRQPYIPH